MKFIKLYSGEIAIIDEEDYEKLSSHKWYGLKARHNIYAARNYYKEGKAGIILMHRELLLLSPNMFIDHINHNGLDNRKCNLRIATNAQNQWNTVRKYIGVYWNKSHKQWMSFIRHNGKRFYLGGYKTKEEAMNKYNEAKIRLRGEYCAKN